MIKRNLQAFEYMEALFRLAQVVGGAPRHHFFTVIQESFKRLFEIEYPWAAVGNGEHVDAERFLQRGVLIELIENDVGYRIAFELDDDTHPFAVRFIAKIRDPINFLLLYQTGNLLDNPILIDHEGDFTDDDLLFTGPFDRLGESLASHLNDAFTLVISLSDRLLAVNETASREIRPRDILHQLLDGEIRIFHQGNQSIDHFPQIVRWNIGCHADRDTRGTVDQQIGNAGWQNRRFFEGVVIVRNEIDCLFFDIRQQLFGETGHPDLGVAHRCRRIRIDGAKISLPIDERITHREVLHQPDDRIVNRGITVGMIFTDDIADEPS